MYHSLLAQRVAENRPIRVGIIGTGKFGGGVVAQLSQMRGMEVSVIAELSVARARHAYTVAGRLPADTLRVANNAGELHDVICSGQRAIVEDGMLLVQCDLVDVVVEATGIPDVGARMAYHAILNRKHVVMVNVEADVTIGPILRRMADSAGVVGVWDVEAGYRRIGEFATGGIGPHDLRLMPDARTLVVANGGIATDPTDRTKLNIPQMRPNLSYLDLTGALLDQVELAPDLHRNSIRHLALRDDGLVGFAMQWEGDEGAATPLLGLHRRGASPLLAEAPLGDELLMRGYAGSIAFAGDGAELAISSPRGGRLHRFSDGGDFLGAVPRADVCGLASLDAGYLASDGLGGLIAVTPEGARALARHPVAWDNHIVALAGGTRPF